MEERKRNYQLCKTCGRKWNSFHLFFEKQKRKPHTSEINDNNANRIGLKQSVGLFMFLFLCQQQPNGFDYKHFLCVSVGTNYVKMERILPVASQWTMGQYGKCYWIKTIWKIRQFIQTESNRSNWYARIRIKYTAKTHWHMVSRTNAIIVCKQKLPLFLRWLELIFKVYIQVESNFVVNHLHGTFSFEGVFSLIVWMFSKFLLPVWVKKLLF